ncbi:hypothetical protein ACOSQ4_016469 [Xanthoceras sorbifolium]
MRKKRSGMHKVKIEKGLKKRLKEKAFDIFHEILSRPVLPREAARVPMAILGRFGAKFAGPNRPTEKRKPEDRVLKSTVGRFSNGVLDTPVLSDTRMGGKGRKKGKGKKNGGKKKRQIMGITFFNF